MRIFTSSKHVAVKFLTIVLSIGLFGLKFIDVQHVSAGPLPTQINSCSDLALIGNDIDAPLSGSYVLGQDIGQGTACSAVVGSINTPFTGTFDGNGHKINLNINTLSDLNVDNDIGVGLFGEIDGGSVHDLMITGSVGGGSVVGGLAGMITGSATIDRVAVVANISANSDQVGGITGVFLSSTLQDSYSAGHVTAANSQFVGGIVGNMSGTSVINRTYSRTNVSGLNYVGGIAGKMNDQALIENSFGVGPVSNQNIVFHGGIAGYATAGQFPNNANDRFDSGRDGTYRCATDADTSQALYVDGCSIVNQNDGQMSYFFNWDSGTPVPMDQWDFGGDGHIWTTRNTDRNFPILTVLGDDNMGYGGPGIPTNLSIVATTGSSVQLTWDPPTYIGESDITDYEIFYREHKDSNGPDDNWNTDFYGTNSYTATHLHPATSYDFKVAARNQVSSGLDSDVLTTSTADDPVISALASSYVSTPGGDGVLIVGENFNNPIVTVGGVQVNVLFSSAKQLLIGSPNHAVGDAALVITNQNTHTATSTLHYVNPIEITTCEQLGNIGVDQDLPLSGYYILNANIDCSQTTLANIGAQSDIYDIHDFTGSFNGQGHFITGISEGYFGLFASTNGASFRDLQILNSNVNASGGSVDTGMLIGDATNTLVSSVVFTNININKYSLGSLGGVIGHAANVLLDEVGVDASSIVSTRDYFGYTTSGGLIGRVDNSTITVRNSYFNGSVGTYGGETAGLIADLENSTGTIINSYAAGSINVTGGSPGQGGGLIAIQNSGNVSITNSFAAQSHGTSNTGGIIGSTPGLTLSGDYYSIAHTTMHCIGTNADEGQGLDPDTCAAISSDDSFYNVINQPMLSWDTDAVWASSEGKFPIFRLLTYSVPGAPTGLQSTSTTPSSIALSWTAPVDDGQADITDYVIEYSVHHENVNDDSWQTVAHDASDATTLTLNYLLPSTSYDFRVSAKNLLGIGSTSDVATISTQSANTVQISDCQGLQDMQNDLTATYVVTAPIDCSATLHWNSDHGFIPVGTHDHPFIGTFDGGNKQISNLHIARATPYIGLFGETNGSQLSDVDLGSVNISGSNNVGALVGYNAGTISNSHVSGTVTGAVEVGGFAGNNHGTISNSYSEITVNVSVNSGGGFVGENHAQITNCYTTGSLTSGDGNYYIGGFAGLNVDEITSSWTSVGVTSPGGEYVGGFVGANSPDGNLTKVFSTGAVGPEEDPPEYVGGLAGDQDGIISESYATGNVFGTTVVGGLVGFHRGALSNSYSKGNVTGHDEVGSLIGEFYDGTITNTYATGAVTGVSSVGALIGSNTSHTNSTYSFFDSDKTVVQTDTALGVGKSTSDMKKIATFTTDLGHNTWNFDSIWSINSNVNNGYPYLDSQLYAKEFSPSSGTPSGGTTVTITGTNFDHVTLVKFGGVSATINSQAARTISVTTPAHAEGAVSVVFNTDNGLSYTASNGFTYALPQQNNNVGGGGVVPFLGVFLQQTNNTDNHPAADSSLPFTDLDNHFAHDFVKILYDLGVVQGRTATEFAPDESLTRAEMVKIAVLTFKYPLSDDLSSLKNYKDVDTNAWYAKYVATAAAAGIVEGYSDGTFRPDAHVKRAEALKILLKAAKKNLDGAPKLPFLDVVDSSWYAPYVNYAFANGIVNGVTATLMKPENDVTRGEMAKMAVKTLQLP